MNPEEPKENISWPNHLIEGVNPIIACVENINTTEPSSHNELPNVKFVSLYGDETMMRKEGFLKAGTEGYVISPIEKINLSSNEFADCTGAIVVGLKKESGENIAFISHQNPDHFLNGDKESFIKDFQYRLKEIKDKCKEGTIDVVLFSGRFAHVREYEESNPDRNFFIKEYIDSIKLLSEQIHQILNFYPEVIVGPKLSPATDTVTFNTQNRRLFLTRHDKNSTDFVESYNAKDIDDVSKTWKPGEWSLPI